MNTLQQKELEFLTAVNPDYLTASELLDRLYPYQLEELFTLVGDNRKTEHLTSWELKIIFLQELMFSKISLEKLTDLVEFYENNPHCRYGKEVKCLVKNLKIGDEFMHLGEICIVLNNDNGKVTAVRNGDAFLVDWKVVQKTGENPDVKFYWQFYFLNPQTPNTPKKYYYLEVKTVPLYEYDTKAFLTDYQASDMPKDKYSSVRNIEIVTEKDFS